MYLIPALKKLLIYTSSWKEMAHAPQTHLSCKINAMYCTAGPPTDSK